MKVVVVAVLTAFPSEFAGLPNPCSLPPNQFQSSKYLVASPVSEALPQASQFLT
jgi:hypothetical protein